MLQQALSPLVQVTHTPSLVISHLHMPMVKLQQQTIMPFIIQQQLHMPPAIIVHRFCNMLHAILSSHEHMIFMPPVHFSILILQQGTIGAVMDGAAPAMGIPIPIPAGIDPDIPVAIGLIIVAAIVVTS